MTLRRLVGPFASLSLAAALAAGGVAATASPAAASTHPGPCAGVSGCTIESHADVDGDGRADQVAWHPIGDHVAEVRVETATGHLLTTRVNVHLWWGGGAWGGTARIDGRPGAEILVGSIQGAHTPMYTMLTYRSGALDVEPSPSALSHKWQVDAAYADSMGWWRHTLADGRVAMTQRIAYRDGQSQRFTGHNVTYAWDGNGWTRVSRVATSYPTAKAAGKIAGFHVSGLAAFPGIS